MISTSAQTKVEADNARLEGAVRMAIDDIDKTLMRKTAREGLVCSLKCYDAAGLQGSAESLQQCVQSCEQPHQKANAVVRQEIGQYQNRLERAIHECAESTRDKMKVGFESDAKLMAKFEDNYVSCIHHTVNEYIGKLKPIKERIIAQLK